MSLESKKKPHSLEWGGVTEREIVYENQFKQKMYIAYFPFTWQGIVLLLFCYLLPVGLMAAGGIYLLCGFLIYRGFVVKKDHEMESIFVLDILIGFKKWIERNMEGNR